MSSSMESHLFPAIIGVDSMFVQSTYRKVSQGEIIRTDYLGTYILSFHFSQLTITIVFYKMFRV